MAAAKRRNEDVIYMRILGLDPGYAIVGYGVVDHVKGENIYICLLYTSRCV